MFRGGFPGFFGSQFGQEQQQHQQAADTNQYYELLEVNKKATIDEIKKSFKKLAIKYHPDRPGGNKQKFTKMKQAYDVLSNPQKRDIYDNYGKKGLQSGGNPNSGFSSMFQMFSDKREKGPKKGKPKLIQLQVTLQEVYQGITKKVTHHRLRCCQTCDGKGGKNVKKCTTCKGRKIIQKMVQLGPGMYTQSSMHCPDCKGQGQIMSKQDRCKTCKGQKIIKKEKILEVAVEAGCPHQKDYIFTGESDQVPGMMAADLYVRVMIKPHPLYIRKGGDLFFKKKISLLEALTGIQFQIKHLDGKNILIKSFQGQTIAPNSVKTIKRMGMTLYKNVICNGNLYIQFEVQFPKKKKLTSEHIQKLKQLLPGPKIQMKDYKDENVHILQQFDQTQLNPNEQGGKASMQDQQQERGGQRVQCAQQ